jgi:hypothetical protein
MFSRSAKEVAVLTIARNCLKCNKAFIATLNTQLYCSIECRKKAENATYYQKHKEQFRKKYQDQITIDDIKLQESLEEYKKDSLKANSAQRQEENKEWLIFSLPHRREDIKRIMEGRKFKPHNFRFTVYEDEEKNIFTCREMLEEAHTREVAQKFWRIAEAKKKAKALQSKQTK